MQKGKAIRRKTDPKDQNFKVFEMIHFKQKGKAILWPKDPKMKVFKMVYFRQKGKALLRQIDPKVTKIHGLQSVFFG